MSFFEMEKGFEYKFNHLIDECKKLQQDSKRKPENIIDSIQLRFFNSEYKKLKEKQIRDLFLRDLLDFYDEYSYRINYKIDEINYSYSLLIKLNKLKNIHPTLLIDKESIKLYNDIKSYKYFDLFYFIEKLEKNVFENFNISILKIRKILYGKYIRHINNNKIKSFYREMFQMRNNIDFFNYNEPHIIYHSSNKLVNKYALNYSTDMITLYEYHEKTYPIKEEDKKRFKSFRDILGQYNYTSNTNYELQERFKNILKTTSKNYIKKIRFECFSYISYLPFMDNIKNEDENVSFFNKFNQKYLLISLIETYNKIIE